MTDKTEGAGNDADDREIGMDDDDRVGYGQPPKEHQFKKGQSGNLRGRPPGSRDLATEFREAVNALIKISEGGRTKKVTKMRAIVERTINKALMGDMRAVDTVMKWRGQYLGEEDAPDADLDLSAEDKAILERHIAQRAPQQGGAKSSEPS